MDQGPSGPASSPANGPSGSNTGDSTGAEPAKKGFVVGTSITDRFKYDPVASATAMDLAQQDVINNCIIRALVSGVGGGVMGVAFGIFMGAMDPAAMSSPAPLPDGKQPSVWSVVKETMQTTRQRVSFYSRSFATIGLLYSGIECVVEKHRARHDWYNSLYTGFITGGILSRGSGPMPMAIGAVTFAAFSVAMDRFLGLH